MDLTNLSITQIKAQLADLDDVSQEIIDALAADTRKGVQELAKQYTQRAAHKAELAAKWAMMNQHESALRQSGRQVIFGIDEVGRGPLAGPVVACAVALPEDFYLPGLNDSKKVSLAMREAFYDVIMRDALAVGIGMVSAERIDQINIRQATHEAMKLAVKDAGIEPDFCLIDAETLTDFSYQQLAIVKGDERSVSIAAASIVAKVTRDRLMTGLSSLYPAYQFDKNAGYGTPEHLEALRLYGVTPLHRKTFGGVKELLA
ncbi:ribonuclease HII [Brevibacillus dissolubilis]|uniref:ribonuclease HII n=1 Tax=Brevibacillus dissolubilis TaxID=1844116 RepID=UPI001116C035|nr:ribonuclease HII [Brevibacillus dissolubilis]